MAGKLYGVGVGPGDPQLMTLKAVKCIEECSIIGIPAENTDTCTAWKIAAEAVPDMADREVLSVYIPMTKDYSVIEAAYDEGSARIRQKLDEGSNIAFLNLGDPTLYGTYMGIHKRIADMGYEARIIPGVTSVCAVAARLGISLGGRGENIHILPGSYCLDEFSRLSGSKIIMKPAGEADYLIKTLAD
ncbi:MAG: precorrin-2 C(20)-methyltransferase, partial [Lachnospiraceae bacterium]|nr:precorrin-2 C(20)-methyltransferase [Lachnospiraceae bacterium]